MALTSKLAMGLGDSTQAALCPSVEQGQGITDCTDPCQVNTPACASTLAIQNLPISTLVNPITDAPISTTPIGQGGNLLTIAPLTSANVASSLIPGISDSTLLLAAAGLVVVLIMSGSGRRR